MKAQYITSKSATQPYFRSMLAGLALLGSVTVATADDLLVNTFDADLSGIAWENWRSYVTGHDRVWDATQDADGNANSGSMYVTVDWPLSSDPTWNNSWNDVQIAFNAGSFAAADYIDVEAFVKVDVANSSTAQDGSYGVIGLYVNGGSGGWQEVQGYATLAATDGWQHIKGSLSRVPAETYDSVVLGFISNGGSSLTNTVNYWVDNIRITAPPSVHTNRPALSIAKAPPAGLTLMASAAGDAWQRQMIRTVNSNYSWHNATANTTTYSINVADFPGAAQSGFEAMMYLIPVTGMSNPDGGSVDWDSAHVAYFTITANADGTGRGNFRYKVNSAAGETFKSWTDFNTPASPLGTWSLSFSNNTNVTITAPDGTSTALNIPEADAAHFQGDLIAYFGVRPTDTARIGQSATFSRIKITGAAGSIDDTFGNLDSATWVRKASNGAGIFITPADAEYWVSWPQPDGGFANLYATDNLGNKMNEWLSLPVEATGWLNVAGDRRLTVVKQSALNALPNASKNAFFGLFHP